jgi:hypothetical protein
MKSLREQIAELGDPAPKGMHVPRASIQRSNALRIANQPVIYL